MFGILIFDLQATYAIAIAASLRSSPAIPLQRVEIVDDDAGDVLMGTHGRDGEGAGEGWSLSSNAVFDLRNLK